MGQNPRTSRYPQTNFHGHLLDGCSPKYRGGPSVLTHRRIVAKIPGPPDQVVMPTARGQMDGFTRAELILETRWTFCTRRRWCETKTGWCLGHLRKIWKSIGMITPNIWENKNLPNHQPENLLGREKKPAEKIGSYSLCKGRIGRNIANNKMVKQKAWGWRLKSGSHQPRQGLTVYVYMF